MRSLTFARSLVTLVVAVVLGGEVWGQSQISIYSNPITGTNPNSFNPYTTGQVVAGNLTGIGVGRGAGITGANANDRYNASSWDTAALDTTAYFSILFSPASGYAVDVASLATTGQVSNSSISNFAVRTSLDSFTTNVTPTTAFSAAAINYAPTDLTNLQTANSGFRIYAWGAGATGNTYSVNDFAITGLVSNRWSGSTSNDFTANANWVSGSAPGGVYANGVQFEGSTNTNVQIGSNTSIQGIRFASGASSFALAGAGIITLNNAGGISNFSSNQQTISNSITFSANQNLFTSGGDLVLSGTLSSSFAVTINKQGTGTVTISRGNLYTGTTNVNAGVLSVTNTSGSATGDSVVTVNSGGTLGGTGTLSGAVTVTSGGTIRGGLTTANNGKLTLGGGLAIQANSTIAVGISGGNASGTNGGSSNGSVNNTLLAITGGTTTIDAGTKFVIDGTGVSFTNNSNYSYRIATGAGDQHLLNINDQALFSTTGFSAQAFSVTGDVSGNIYLNFQPVPEPATVLAIGAAGLGAVSWVRRRRQKAASASATAA